MTDGREVTKGRNVNHKLRLIFIFTALKFSLKKNNNLFCGRSKIKSKLSFQKILKY